MCYLAFSQAFCISHQSGASEKCQLVSREREHATSKMVRISCIGELVHEMLPVAFTILDIMVFYFIVYFPHWIISFLRCALNFGTYLLMCCVFVCNGVSCECL